jgi:hypothetical protein
MALDPPIQTIRRRLNEGQAAPQTNESFFGSFFSKKELLFLKKKKQKNV